MSYKISPVTPEGMRAVAAAAALIEPFCERADAADRANEMCSENFTDMQRSGVASSFVPVDLGGFGLVCGDRDQHASVGDARARSRIPQ